MINYSRFNMYRTYCGLVVFGFSEVFASDSGACPPLTLSEKLPFSDARVKRSNAYDESVRTRFLKVKQMNPTKVVNVFFTRHAESDENASNIAEMLGDKVADARLSQLGVAQAIELSNFVSARGPTCKQNEEFWKENQQKMSAYPGTRNIRASNDCGIAAFLRGESNRPVMLATSSLSRAILTGVIGYRSRIESLPFNEHVHMLSLLEEATSGWTSQMSVSACEFPRLQGNMHQSLVRKYPALAKQTAAWYYDGIKKKFDLTGAQLDRNVVPKGGKFWSSKVPQANKDKRFLDFCYWAMSNEKVNDVIVVGHSNWIREFLMSRIVGTKNDLENVLTQADPKVKLGNAGVLAFRIVHSDVNACTVLAGNTEFVFGTLSVDKPKDKSGKEVKPSAPRNKAKPTYTHEPIKRPRKRKQQQETTKETRHMMNFLHAIIILCIFN